MFSISGVFKQVCAPTNTALKYDKTLAKPKVNPGFEEGTQSQESQNGYKAFWISRVMEQTIQLN